MNRKSKIIVSVVGITIVLLALLGITYAYYLTRIEGNTNTNSISVTTADLKLVYGDGNGLIEENDIMPGTTITKTFTVTNSGKSEVRGYAIIIEDLVNSLTRPEDLTYTLECKLNDATSCGKIENVVYPKDVETPTIYINDIGIDLTQNYTLTIHYVNLTEVDQSQDMGKGFGGKINIVDGSSVNPYKLTNVANPTKLLAYNIVENARAGKTGTTLTWEPKTIPLQEKIYKESEIEMGGTEGTFSPTVGSYFAYGDFIDDQGDYYTLRNAQVKQYTGDLSFLDGKYIMSYSGYDTEEEANYDIYGHEMGTVYYVKSISSSSINYIGGSVWDGIINYKIKKIESTLTPVDDEYGQSYYFRGGVEDNYVLFNNMCFRIVRIEGDGSVKLAMAGDISEGTTTCYEVGDNTGLLSNSDGTPISYGFNSIETAISNWYSEKFNTTELQQKLKTDKWYLGGNDNYIFDDNGNLIENNIDGIVGYYAAGARINANTLSLKGINEDYNEEKYGLLTIDEIAFAGTTEDGLNEDYYLFQNAKSGYWTYSKFEYDASRSKVFVISENYGNIGILYSDESYGMENYVRPSITLIPETELVQGDGTKTNPYIID